MELNAVWARRVARPDDYPWSSARAHWAGRDDRLVRVAPLAVRFADWRELMAQGVSAEEAETFRRHEVGCPRNSQASNRESRVMQNCSR